MELNSQRYHIHLNTTIHVPPISGLHVGDVVTLDKVREIGTGDRAVMGDPYVEGGWFSIKAEVVKQCTSKKRSSGTDLRVVEITIQDLLVD